MPAVLRPWVLSVTHPTGSGTSQLVPGAAACSSKQLGVRQLAGGSLR